MTVPDARTPASASGYTVVLPPGWARIDARGPDGVRQLDRELDAATKQLPRDTYGPAITAIRREAHQMLDSARQAGALDLYLPLAGMHGQPVPASFVVRAFRFPEPPPTRPDASATEQALTIATGLATRMPGGEVIETPAGIAIRAALTVPPTPDRQVASRRVDYYLAIPGEPLDWAVASCSVLEIEQAPELAPILVDLFDAIMTTWRWSAGLTI